ncbi:hypothetical protein NIES22_67940 (plasmid) [Calothrix brevissima NIES-22]|nr:hypothetical protein NIES22_67940 [Calothrix brevissima NIES-22]
MKTIFSRADAGSNQFKGIRAALKTDAVLQELTKSPLTLNIMTLVYQKFSLEQISRMPLAERRKDLFDRYIERMFSRRKTNIKDSSSPKYDLSYQETLSQKWLIWLALNMENHSQTIFLIERIQPNWLPSKKDKLLYSLLFSLSFGGIGGLLIGIIVWLTIGILFPMIWGFFLAASLALFYALIGSIWAGLTIGKVSCEIEPLETLNWSIKNLSKSIIGGGVAGLLIYKFTNMNVFLIVGLLIGIIFGIEGPNLEKTMIPNEGIWQSLKNTIFFSIIGVVGLGIPAAFQTKELLSIVTNSSTLQNQISNINLVISGIIAGLFFGFTKAGIACLQHFVLRIITYLTQCTPWNYAHFLNYATERIFLQKVGGGYIFIHRSLREHFANLRSNL